MKRLIKRKEREKKIWAKNMMTHRRRKVLNIVCVRGGGSEYRAGWGAKGGGGKLFAGCKLNGAPAPKSVPNNYIFHIENR